MMRFFRIILVVTSLVCFSGAIKAQDCELTLTQATEEFQAGHFYSISSILSKCLDNFTTEQKLRANILLTQTYLLLDDPVGARRSYLEVLKANPEFVADPAIHSMDIVYLSRKFTTRPIFSWLAKGGVNISPIRVIYDNDIFGEQSAREGYSPKLGYQAAIAGDVNIYDRISLRAEIQYQYSTYEHRTSEFFEADKKRFSERMSWVNAPVALLYTQQLGKFRPYGYAGYSVGYLLRDMATITLENIRGVEVGNDVKQSPALNFTGKRNRWNQSILVGGGVKMKFGLQFLFVDVRYSLGLKNIVNEKNLFTDMSTDPESEEHVKSGQAAFSYSHVDDYFRLDNLSVAVGFIQPIYKPRDLKKSRIRLDNSKDQ